MAAKVSLVLLMFVVMVVCCSFGGAAIKVGNIVNELPTLAQLEANYLIKFAKEIDAGLKSSQSEDTEALMEMVKTTFDQKVSMFDFLTADPSKNGYLRKAFKLFLSLRDALKSCDYKSYDILAMNYMALEANKRIFKEGPRKSIQIFRDFAGRHAEKCRPTYGVEFKNLLERSSAKRKNFDKLDKFFENFNLNEDILDPTGQSAKLANPLTGNLIDKVFELNGDSRPDEESSFLAIEKWLKPILTELLVNPCEVYHGQFREFFASAIFDSAFEDEHQQEFLYPSELSVFDKALRYFRACTFIAFSRGHLLQDMSAEMIQRRKKGLL